MADKLTYIGICEAVARGARILRGALGDSEPDPVSFDTASHHRPNVDVECLQMAFGLWRESQQPYNSPGGLGGGDSPVGQVIQSLFGPKARMVPVRDLPLEVLMNAYDAIGQIIADKVTPNPPPAGQ